ncbi:DUF2249 domain-containing protein [Ferruginivarius sediminum]|nr:DUF2249 domain-containing protein [Ferruginivarius sediminum]
MSRPLDSKSPLFDALMSREDLFDRLLELDGTIARFHRVLLNEETARRLSLADTAAMLGTSPDDLTHLANGGELAELSETDTSAELVEQTDAGPAAVLDTRPIFEAGHEPLLAILDAVAELPPGGALLVQAPFHPVPLRRLLGQRGFHSKAHQRGDSWEVTFVSRETVSS